MSIGMQDLSTEMVVQLTGILARRPEYGIAIPSRKWLVRQEEKMDNLPKELLKPANPLRRLAFKIADRFDSNIVDPQAVLCRTHAVLNPFLIRRIFMALAYEVTVFTDPLRSWPGRTWSPEISAFVGRLDSIAALWTEPQLFQEIYGNTPFDGHHIYVRSACEACCLAAVGASGQALADLRAALSDRIERRNGKGLGKQPRFYRFVEGWIDHLRKGSGGEDRAAQCRAASRTVLAQLRSVRPAIRAWKAEQKNQHADLRAAQQPVFAELKRTNAGNIIKPLPASLGPQRRTRNGIPVALADVQGAENQRLAALRGNRPKSIYRPDSIAAFSMANEELLNGLSLSNEPGLRPLAPEPPRGSVPSDGLPTQSFLQRFESEMGPASNHSDNRDTQHFGDGQDHYDFQDEQDTEERDYAGEEASRAKVQAWWASQVAGSHLSTNPNDTKSVLSMVHPAFRPTDQSTYTAASAKPDPLDVKKDRQSRTSTLKSRPQTVASEWTDCSVHTTTPYTQEPGTGEVPPMPRVPSQYGNQEPPPPSPAGRSAPVNWPAPPLGRQSPGRQSPGRQSTVSSKLTKRSSKVSTSRASGSTRPTSYAASSVYDRGSVTTMASPTAPPHRWGMNDYKPMSPYDGDRAQKKKKRGSSAPQPATVRDEDEEDEDCVGPDDSISNVGWNKHANGSEITQLGRFKGKM
ncbi:hypothetical protein F4802DRAFT_599794 [Xylaria palmicola]|nr:hypothetical protein F4802DRAFT_599794 [Xylaria palmicola]